MTSRPPLGDLLLAAVLTAITIAAAAAHLGVPVPIYGLVVLTAVPIAFRQVYPVTTFVVIAVATAVYLLLGHEQFPNAGIGLLIGLFSVATLRPRPIAAAVAVGISALTVLGYTIRPGPLRWTDLVQDNVAIAVIWVLGESTRRWGERSRRLTEQAARAAADERVRIARELHDVVAHHMSVISLQAGVAGFVLDTDPAAARAAMRTVSDSTHEALGEMRRMLDVLRVDPSGEADVSPQPGLALLDELVDRTRAAGLPVEVIVSGDPRPLPPGADLCAYRIVQESLTNVLKHAGPARARVELGYGERVIMLRVSDDGRPGRPGPAPSPGSHGIRGMRERAKLYGGTLSAGPVDGGGFHVVARLPTADQP